MAKGVGEISWLKKILKGLKLSFKPFMKLFCNNKAVINIVSNPIQHGCTNKAC